MTDGSGWVRTMIAPDDLTAAEAAQVERRGFAYLLSGRFAEYLRLASERDLPKFGQVHYEKPSQSQSLLEALALYLGNSASAMARLREIGRSGSGDLRTAAVVLASIALADNFDPRAAAEILQSELVKVRSPLNRALVLTHLGVRNAELGELRAAIECTDKASRIVAKLRSSKPAMALGIVVRSNLWRFRSMTGLIGQTTGPLRRDSPVLAAIDSLQLDGLQSYVNEQFESALRDPSVVHLSFRSEDPVDARLTGALLRCETLADWETLNAIRKTLGRYRLLTCIGIPDRQPDAAFYMLRRAGDAEGIEMGVRVYMRRGPLQPLQRLASFAAETPWLAPEFRAVLNILSGTAEVMPQASADHALTRLAEGFPPNQRHHQPVDFFTSMDAVRALIQVCSPEIASTTVSALLDALADKNAINIQGVARAAGAVDWTRLTSGVIDGWLQFVTTHLGEPSDEGYVALIAAAGLARARRHHVAELAANVFLKQPTLPIASLMLEAETRLTATSAEAISSLALQEIQRIRSDAARGQFSLGRVADAAVVLAAVLTRYPRTRGWRELVEFMTDPLVGWSDRLGAFRYVLRRPQVIPAREKDALRRFVGKEPEVSVQMFVHPAEVRGQILELAVRLGAGDSKRILARIVALATEPTPQSRIAAASVLEVAFRQRPFAPLVALALVLAHDPHFEVRAAGGAAIAGITFKEEESLAALIDARILELLADPGTAAPRAMLDSLFERKRLHRVDSRVRNLVERLKVASPSVAVRWRAERLLSVE